MQKVFHVAALCGLALLYAYGLSYGIGWAARIDFPWQPLQGKPAWEIYLLMSIPHALAVLAMSILTGTPVALLARAHPFWNGLAVSFPVVTIMAWSVYPFLPSSIGLWMMLFKDLAIVLFTPAWIAMLAWHITHKMKPSAPTSVHSRGAA